MFTGLSKKRAVVLLLLVYLTQLGQGQPANPEDLAPPPSDRVRTPLCPDPLPISLSSTLGAALASSPALDRQLSVLRQRDYQVEEAYTAANPTATFQTQYQRIEPPVALPTGLIISPADNYSFALTLRQPLYTFGRLKYDVLAAKLTRRAAQEEYLDRLQEVILGGADLYIQALVTAEALSIAADDLEAQRANLRVTEALFNQGVAAKFDVLRTSAASAQAEQILIEANTSHEIALDRLRSFMDLDSNQALELSPLDLPDPPEVEMSQMQPVILEKRPDLRALRWAVEAGKARISLARAENAPSLYLQNQTINQNATGFAPGTQNTTSVVLAIPLFDGGVSRTRALQAEEAVEQLKADLEQRERDVLVQAEEAYRQMQDLWRSIQVAQENVTQAEEAMRVALLRYESGISTTVELLDTQAARARARFGLAKAKADYQRAFWEWRRVSADEFPVEVPLPPVIRERLTQENSGE